MHQFISFFLTFANDNNANAETRFFRNYFGRLECKRIDAKHNNTFCVLWSEARGDLCHSKR